MSMLSKNQKQNNDQIFRLMTPTIIGIIACVFCLISMSWAWFTASVNTDTPGMQSATRSTTVKVYETKKIKDAEGNIVETTTLIKPSAENSVANTKSVSDDNEKEDKDASIVTSDESLVWNLSPESSYEVVMTGSGSATTGYCKVALSHAESGKDTETKLYTTSAFDKDYTFTFTYNTGGFADEDGVTATQWEQYVEKTTPPTLTIASYWGKPKSEKTSTFSLMSAGDDDEFMLLSNGDVLGLAPIPCPEAKAETEVELEGFEVQEGEVISAEEDYKVSLTLKDGYEMPGEVTVNIGGKDYVVSTNGTEASADAPYYDAQTGVLTVPSTLLSDGDKISVKASATQIPSEDSEEETEENPDEIAQDEETQEDESADETQNSDIVADNPAKKEEDSDQTGDEPVRTPIGGGSGGDDDESDDDSDDSASDSGSSSDSGEDEENEEKADVKLNLSQLTINLEETQIPTNADLVLTLAAKEDMELPEHIVITLDKTVREEDADNEENVDGEETEKEDVKDDPEEDKTEYIINTDGKDNPEGFEFDAESGELTISSELLEGVREITISDTVESESDEEDEKAEITFEVKNLAFDFTDDEVVTDEDVIITFTAGEGYELPETIVITVDGVEYTVYTSEEDSDKNPDGITFDPETGTLTLSKELLEDVEEITITAEGIKKEDEESGDDGEDTDTDKTDDPDNNENNGSETEGGDAADKDDNGEDGSESTDKTEPDDNTDTDSGENTGTTEPGTDTNNPSQDGEDGESDTSGNDTTVPDTDEGTDEGQGGNESDTEGKDDSVTDDNESGDSTGSTSGSGNDNDDDDDSSDSETSTEPDEPVVTPEGSNSGTSNEDASQTDGKDNGESDDANSDSEDSNSGTDNKESDSSDENSDSGESATSSSESEKSDTSDESATSGEDASSAGDTSSDVNTSDGSESLSKAESLSGDSVKITLKKSDLKNASLKKESVKLTISKKLLVKKADSQSDSTSSDQ